MKGKSCQLVKPVLSLYIYLLYTVKWKSQFTVRGIQLLSVAFKNKIIANLEITRKALRIGTALSPLRRRKAKESQTKVVLYNFGLAANYCKWIVNLERQYKLVAFTQNLTDS
ncbi:hypothetical protein CR513_10285, partial [Mucuna pruriens]